MTTLHRFESRLLRLEHLFLRDVAVLVHLSQHVVASVDQPLIIAHWAERRGLRHSCQKRCLFKRQVFQRRVEIALRGRRHTIGILAKENLIEVQFKDPVLAQRPLDPRCKNDLAHLTLDVERVVEQHVFDNLLRDRRCTAHIAPTRTDCLNKRGGNGARIIAHMVVEIAIFGGHERISHKIGDLVGGRKQPPLGREFINDHALP